MMGILITILVLIVLSQICCLIFLSTKVKKSQDKQHKYHDIVNQSLETFAHAIDAKDENTNGHSVRVAIYSAEIARRMGMTEEEQEQIYYMGMLHDIGKIGIPDAILQKPGKLTEEEMQIIRNHPTIGGEILKDFTAIQGISNGARYHHERYDGNGYNEGLKGEEIPLAARIICVADSYDTMSSKRVYKELHEEDYILSELDGCSGKQFDPAIVPFTIDMIKDGTAPLSRSDYKSR